MTIQRYSITAQYNAEIYVDEDDWGIWVLHKDYLCAVESLEYDIRYLREQLDLVREERNYYEDKCRELEELDLFSLSEHKVLDKT